MSLKKYSKSSSFYLSSKKNYFEQNNLKLKEVLDINLKYKAQKNRNNCKICDADLYEQEYFISHQIKYVFCSKCFHLNGIHDDTKEFAEFMYMEDDGKDYAINYVDASYKNRVDDIYDAKAKFLLEIEPSLISKKVIDVGCGGGHFVAALIDNGFEATGIDVSKQLVSYGNKNINEIHNIEPLVYEDEKNLFSKIKYGADIVSAIGVIEHMRKPLDFLKEFRNSNAEYLYFSVPMLSSSIIFEHIFQNVFPRQLSAGHTHLFSEESIKVLLEKAGCESIGEWRFGSDIMDLYRCIDLNLQDKKSSAIKALSEKKLFPLIDKLQAVLDQEHFCSEIHLLAKKISNE